MFVCVRAARTRSRVPLIWRASILLKTRNQYMYRHFYHKFLVRGNLLTYYTNGFQLLLCFKHIWTPRCTLAQLWNVMHMLDTHLFLLPRWAPDIEHSKNGNHGNKVWLKPSVGLLCRICVYVYSYKYLIYQQIRRFHSLPELRLTLVESSSHNPNLCK
jgi:hypothetical protein